MYTMGVLHSSFHFISSQRLYIVEVVICGFDEPEKKYTEDYRNENESCDPRA